MTAHVATVLAALLLAGCGGGATGVYFLERPNRIRHLEAVGRPANGMQEALVELLRGPSAVERAEGLSSAIPGGTRLRGLSVEAGTASVFLASASPWQDGFYATAQLVYTLTAFPEVERVVLRVNGRRCCVYDMQSRPWSKPLTRALFRGWQGEPG